MANDNCERFLYATTLASMSALLNTPDYLLAVPPERGTTNRRLAWILKEHRGTLPA